MVFREARLMLSMPMSLSSRMSEDFCQVSSVLQVAVYAFESERMQVCAGGYAVEVVVVIGQGGVGMMWLATVLPCEKMWSGSV